jgi:hypothetical protein
MKIAARTPKSRRMRRAVIFVHVAKGAISVYIASHGSEQEEQSFESHGSVPQHRPWAKLSKGALEVGQELAVIELRDIGVAPSSIRP